jgi:hypothetical protein
MPIPFVGQLTQQQYLHAQYLHFKPASRGRILRRSMILLLVLGLLLSLAIVPFLLRLIVPVVLLGIFLLSASWFLPRLHVYLTWRYHRSLQAPMSGTITADGIHYKGTHFQGEVTWSMFLKYKQSPQLVLLYQSPLVFNLFPRSFFRTEHEWHAFLELVQQHVPVTVEGEARTQRLQWLTFILFLAGTAIISFLVHLWIALQ